MSESPPIETSPDDGLCDKPKPIDVWFEDGTLLIKAEGTEFKVYRGILASKSTVFRDMFELNPHTTQEVPVLELSVSALDLAFFLKALHDIDFFLPPRFPNAAPFAIVAGILRLSDMYDVPNLRKRAIEHLSVVYPTSIAEWDSSPQFEKMHILDHFGAIKLARDFNVSWIRPMAIYHVASLSFNATLYRCLRDANLDPQDEYFVIRGIRALKMLQALCSGPDIATNPRKCQSIEVCRSLLKAKRAAVLTDDGADPLKVAASYSDGFCGYCMTLEAPLAREGVWSQIPAYLADAQWAELALEKRRATFVSK
ncbi:hypothetical protein DXG03_003948 [Asterophora parasitica]|uniref:BTB domain-containing protein n=1 Tax=Asterophora parasitica TaxID=117018 RepID=A0A9P7K983_9AGAR|nr:hypothetical protein DXG03_003948 [Asterophora parasitica]